MESLAAVSVPIGFPMTSNTRVTLLERLRDASDHVAWEEFFRLYGPAMYAYARYVGGSDATAQEVVQEAMLTIFQRRDLFRYDPARGRFRDWLRTVVRHKLYEYRRQPAQRLRGEGGETEVREPTAPDTAPDAVWEELFEQALLAALLEVLRQEMNPRSFQAFELLTLQELSGDEAARITGLSRNAAYLARRRALQRLQELGETYRDRGQLDRRLRQALELPCEPSLERALSERVEQSLRARWEETP